MCWCLLRRPRPASSPTAGCSCGRASPWSRSSWHRRILAAYTVGYLRQVRDVSAAVTLLAYCLFAFERAAAPGVGPWFQLSIVPVTVGLLHYGLLLERGQGGAPEELVLRDRTLQ